MLNETRPIAGIFFGAEPDAGKDLYGAVEIGDGWGAIFVSPVENGVTGE